MNILGRYVHNKTRLKRCKITVDIYNLQVETDFFLMILWDFFYFFSTLEIKMLFIIVLRKANTQLILFYIFMSHVATDQTASFTTNRVIGGWYAHLTCKAMLE